ncbi:Uncharacterised protein [Burkholderia pseudomallei]|nr:Uncharacterised protein [Burkholderia pseudomallei]CAJ4567120.1 Uncharacterised protein [Burkholderia pseudomallei]CAJ5206814.1 Uncharacterised protein [Burkholderia pseudomallei]CAJ5303780.1 Uncharacterised protein [Burkholderia pseudomallei]CAK0571905.1 Uncharacterised protein [Burkholderia pseudomallei]
MGLHTKQRQIPGHRALRNTRLCSSRAHTPVRCPVRLLMQHLRQQLRHDFIVMRARSPRARFVMQTGKPLRDKPLLPGRDRRGSYFTFHRNFPVRTTVSRHQDNLGPAHQRIRQRTRTAHRQQLLPLQFRNHHLDSLARHDRLHSISLGHRATQFNVKLFLGQNTSEVVTCLLCSTPPAARARDGRPEALTRRGQQCLVGLAIVDSHRRQRDAALCHAPPHQAAQARACTRAAWPADHRLLTAGHEVVSIHSVAQGAVSRSDVQLLGQERSQGRAGHPGNAQAWHISALRGPADRRPS